MRHRKRERDMCSTFNLLKQLLHLVLAPITVYVHLQYMVL
jgi:hypothetical protein